MEPILLWPGGAPGALGAGPEDCPNLVPYPVRAAEPAPAIVICPGGGYTRRAPHEGEPIALWLNTLGIAAYVLTYRVSPYRHPHPLMDAQRAIRYLRHHAERLHLHPEKIGVLGFSAGGHLAASAANLWDYGDKATGDPVDNTNSKPNLAVLCYPVITFGPHRHHGSLASLLGPEPTEETRHLLSMEEQVTALTPPTFLWHTVDDAAVPVENSLMFAAALRRHRVSFEMHIYDKGRHGLGLAAEEDAHVGTWTQQCGQWLARQGFGRGPG